MCGIIGYIGNRKASEIITEGLLRLEYRGYDSVGIAIGNDEKEGEFEIRKEKGMVDEVSTALQFTSIDGKMGIGHTRWATHGAPCKLNAHPHHDCEKKVVLVHNGVIENYLELKNETAAKGHKILSETDSEIIAHLIEQYLKDGLAPMIAFVRATEKLKGSYAIVCMIKGENKIYTARKNSPLILGIGQGELFCASDIPAMLGQTKTFLPLEDGDIAILEEGRYRIFDVFGNEIFRRTIELDWDSKTAEKGGFQHFMLKEINDQKHFIYESLSADTSIAKEIIKNSERIHLIACGTSYHASLLFKILLQKQWNKNAEAYIASEYPFVTNPSDKDTIIAITQSGETADTIQAVKFAKSRGAKIIALTNVVQSSITRIADNVIYLNAGPEISVAATKTFVSQLAVIYKLMFEDEKGINILTIPKIFEKTLKNEDKIKKLAEKIKDKRDVFFIGRGICYPIALEGALKLKEISYIHAEAYPGGELKHGPISLIEDGVPVVALVPKDESFTKMHGSLKEIKSRGAFVIAITDEEKIAQEVDETVEIPAVDNSVLYPFGIILSLQMLAYYVSTMRGINPDKPRNLAKSVTVE